MNQSRFEVYEYGFMDESILFLLINEVNVCSDYMHECNIPLCVCVCVSVYACVHASGCVHACMHACVCVCMCVCVCHIATRTLSELTCKIINCIKHVCMQY